MEKPRIQLAIVNLYGCNLDSPLSMYLEKVAITVCEEDIRHVILCGGPSQQKSFPGETEANVAFGYLSEILPIDCHFYFYLEDRSLNTFRNVKYAADIYCKQIEPSYDVYRICYFSEALRALKTARLARRFFPDFRPGKSGRDIRFETASWEQMHPDLELAATIKDWLSIYVPPLETFLHNQRARKAKTK